MPCQVHSEPQKLELREEVESVEFGQNQDSPRNVHQIWHVLVVRLTLFIMNESKTAG